MRPGRWLLRAKIGDHSRRHHPLPDWLGFFALDGNGQRDLVGGSKEADVEPVEVFVHANVRNRIDIDEPVSDADKLGVHSVLRVRPTSLNLSGAKRLGVESRLLYEA